MLHRGKEQLVGDVKESIPRVEYTARDLFLGTFRGSATVEMPVKMPAKWLGFL